MLPLVMLEIVKNIPLLVWGTSDLETVSFIFHNQYLWHSLPIKVSIGFVFLPVRAECSTVLQSGEQNPRI